MGCDVGEHRFHRAPGSLKEQLRGSILGSYHEVLAVGNSQQGVQELEPHEGAVWVHEAHVALGVLLNVHLHEDDVQVLGLAVPAMCATSPTKMTWVHERCDEGGGEREVAGDVREGMVKMETPEGRKGVESGEGKQRK